MHLLLYLNDKLVDVEPLNLAHLCDDQERNAYIQGAIKLMLEKWNDVLEEQDVVPRFTLKLDHGERL